jgi:hypothetical protein
VIHIDIRTGCGRRARRHGTDETIHRPVRRTIAVLADFRRQVAELARKDYVRKAIDPADKRRINVEITSRSSGIVDRFIGRFKASIGSLLEAVGAPQIGR